MALARWLDGCNLMPRRALALQVLA